MGLSWIGSGFLLFCMLTNGRAAGALTLDGNLQGKKRKKKNNNKKTGGVLVSKWQMTRHGLTDDDTPRGSYELQGLVFLFLMGGCDCCGRRNVTKIFTFVFRTAWLRLQPLCWWWEVLQCSSQMHIFCSVTAERYDYIIAVESREVTCFVFRPQNELTWLHRPISNSRFCHCLLQNLCVSNAFTQKK